MKRIALVLAAAVLGTGCIVVDDDDCSTPSLAVDWSFQLSDGTTAGCAGAGVAEVDVYLDGQFVNTYPCAQGGVTIGGVGPGSHDLVVEGIELLANDFRIAYRDSHTVVGGECGMRRASVRPAEGTVNLDYSVAGCSASPCFLWFSVRDDIAGGMLAAVIGDTSPASVKDDFEYDFDVRIRLAAGSYTLEWMELVSRPGVVYTGERISCEPNGIAFDVGAALETVVPVNLACVP